jgi:hypothetical protein
VPADRRGPTGGGALLLRTLRFGPAEDPAELRAAWGCAALDYLPALVQLERCATWLLRRLTELGAESVVDPPFMIWLVARVRAGAARNMLVESRALDLARWLTARDIPFVFLKGMARRLVAGRYPMVDARVTTDVDVLLQGAEAEPVWRALQEDGYRFATTPEAIPAGHFHLVPLTHRDGVSIELHTSTAPAVAASEAWRRNTELATLTEREGLRLLLPSATEMLWQSVVHAEIDGSSAYDLRHFQDAAVLLAAADLDWSVILARFTAPEIGNLSRMKGWFAAAAWLAGISLPAALQAGGKAFNLERALRWRYTACRLAGPRRRVTEMLVDEATRAEAGLGMAQCLAGTPLPLRARRRIATTLARAGYLGWRAARLTEKVWS